MAKRILNAVPERLYETTIPVYTYHFVVVQPLENSDETKVRCPYCGGLYDQDGIESHISGCSSNPDNRP